MTKNVASSKASGGFSIGIDIGGTFTDCIVVAADGSRTSTKSLTTPEDRSQGVINCLEMAARELSIELRALLGGTVSFVHGTTVATNALTTRRGARTGLLMTKGHEQSILIGRVQQKIMGLSEREKTHVTHLTKATPPIVSPLDIRPVVERIDNFGKVIVPLDRDAAKRELDLLVEAGIEALAICLLWSFRDPSHEIALREIAQRDHPQLYISISSEIAPRLGEYERCVSTVLNAYVGKAVSHYLAGLEQKLQDRGLNAPLMVIQANGGLTTATAALERPLAILDSGPAGGVLGARHLAELVGYGNVLCADVGGTTFDVGIIHDGRVQIESTPVIDQYQYVMPKIYLKSIGAGGGSIAWIDRAGGLRVGPQSAGSNPGPVAYGLGGTEPTVTDAQVALGYLDPEFVLGRQVKLDKSAALAALERVGKKLDMSAMALAAGIVQIASAQMADLARKVTLERGLDPRGFTLFTYGGAGPLFGAFMIKDLGAKGAYVPAESGVFSAFGMLTTDVVFQEERAVALRSPLNEQHVSAIASIYADLEARLERRFTSIGAQWTNVKRQRSADMRFSMQVHELDIDVGAGSVDLALLDRLRDDFVIKYETVYGKDSAYTAAGVEYVTLKVSGTLTKERPPASPPRGNSAVTSLAGQRQAYFAGAGLVDTKIHLGDRLVPGQKLSGPAIIQRTADTVVLPPGTTANVDKFGGLVISWLGRERAS